MRQVVTEEDVRRAAKTTKIIPVDRDTLITPAATDLAKEKGVLFEDSAIRSQVAKQAGSIIDEFPVKKVAIASDHGGFDLKTKLIPYIKELGYTILDLGPQNPNPCDYPDFAFQVASLVSERKVQRGIMIDSVGIGSAMAANRVKGVLAAKCNNAFEARSAREHNYANVLTLGAKIIGEEIAKEIVKFFLQTPGGTERHKKRVEKMLSEESK
jgi:ribose 5-phosphate isomerase B